MINALSVLRDAKTAGALSPTNAKLNIVLKTLVKHVEMSSDDSYATITNGINMTELWSLLAEAEGQMEAFWAREIVDDVASIEDFPYFDNYQLLTQREHRAIIKAMASGMPKPKRLVFIGSGPLPLSAMLLAQQLDLPTLCIDCDEQAAKLSIDVISNAHPGGYLAVESCNGTDVEFHCNDLVFVAALVDDKQDILERASKTETHVAVRDATGIRRVLYPELELSHLVDRLLATEPGGDGVINRLRIYAP